jgi:hypothetical protein
MKAERRINRKTGNGIIVPLVFAAAFAGTAFLFAGCETAKTAEGELRDLTLKRQSGQRVEQVQFDTSFSRYEYVILGEVTGEGRVERKLIEEGEKPAGSNRTEIMVDPDTKEDAFRTYYIYEYDRSYGTWGDEGNINIDTIGDNKMSLSDERSVRHMETIAARIALYNALEKLPEVDAILLPKYEFSYEVEDLIYGKEMIIDRDVKAVSAVVRGKAVKIKTDEELYATYQRFPWLLGISQGNTYVPEPEGETEEDE